jgi:hypothetical protein
MVAQPGHAAAISAYKQQLQFFNLSGPTHFEEVV